MQRFFLTSFLLLLAIVLTTACSPFRIYTDYDSQADFSRYKTFKLLKSSKGRNKLGTLDNQLNRVRIRRTVTSALQEKGYKPIKKGKADFLVATYITLQKKVDVTTYGYYGWRHPGPRYREVRHYKQGSIVIDIIDGAQKQLVWRGVVEDALRYEDNPEEDVQHAVEAVMKDFPPDK